MYLLKFILSFSLIISSLAIALTPGEYKDGLPSYTLEEIAKHKTKETNIWVTYKDGVYNITNFVKAHPGGDRILRGAGGSIDTFWKMYPIHQTPHIHMLLENYRIGNINKSKQGNTNKVVESQVDIFKDEPKRNSKLKVNVERPFNAESPIADLTNKYLTPNDLFFVRNHMPVPVVEPMKYKLSIANDELATIYLSLDDLKTKFKEHTITATIQCTGNRRRDMAKVKPVKGISWEQGAISTATWQGAKLSEVLAYAGINIENNKVKHIQFEGLDTNESGSNSEYYGTSIPIEKVMDPKGDVLLAYKMNGEELPRDHGYPVRAVVPGTVGARSVKWLSKIIASEKESQSFWQQQDYKIITIEENMVVDKLKAEPAMHDMPIQSVIISPQSGTQLDITAQVIKVNGYAFSGSGRKVAKVDVSIDGGTTWQQADISKTEQDDGQAWAWQFWEKTFQLNGSMKELSIYSKATDTKGNFQPKDAVGIWNVRGLANNSWHNVIIHRG